MKNDLLSDITGITLPNNTASTWSEIASLQHVDLQSLLQKTPNKDVIKETVLTKKYIGAENTQYLKQFRNHCHFRAVQSHQKILSKTLNINCRYQTALDLLLKINARIDYEISLLGTNQMPEYILAYFLNSIRLKTDKQPFFITIEALEGNEITLDILQSLSK